VTRDLTQSGVLALSLGDPAGIGPEIVAKAWAALRHQGPAFVVIGDGDILAAQGVPVARIDRAETASQTFAEALPVLDRPLEQPVTPGLPSKDHAGSIIRWIEEGVDLALSGEVAGLVTAPISKAPLYEAGFKFPGHTEFLASLTAHVPMDGARGPVMMLTSGDLRAVLVTVHLPLVRVSEALTLDSIIHTAAVTAQALRQDFGIDQPRLALAGLNPHAGESGTIGDEEVRLLIPAVAQLKAMGIAVSGPKPADSLFHAEARQHYDAVVCLYHDQALIPVKMLDFWGGVNVSLGLPIVRTSPDHGTGFDIAGQGLARADSLIAAVRMADQIASVRQAGKQAAP
jgi:4-hydroxythreonine-4-phosphate dehydrogenase